MEPKVIDSLARLIAWWPDGNDNEIAYLAMLDAFDRSASAALEALYGEVHPALAQNVHNLQEKSSREVTTLEELSRYIEKTDVADGGALDELAAVDAPATWTVDEFAWRPATTSSTLALLRAAVYDFVGPETDRGGFHERAVDLWSQRETPSLTFDLADWVDKARKLLDGDPWRELKSSSGLADDDDLAVVLGCTAQALSDASAFENGLALVFRDHFLRFKRIDDTIRLTAEAPFVFHVRAPLALAWEDAARTRSGGLRSAHVPAGSMLFLAAAPDSRVGSGDSSFDAIDAWIAAGVYKTAPSWFTSLPPVIDLDVSELNLREVELVGAEC